MTSGLKSKPAITSCWHFCRFQQLLYCLKAGGSISCLWKTLLLVSVENYPHIYLTIISPDTVSDFRHLWNDFPLTNQLFIYTSFVYVLNLLLLSGLFASSHCCLQVTQCLLGVTFCLLFLWHSCLEYSLRITEAAFAAYYNKHLKMTVAFFLKTGSNDFRWELLNNHCSISFIWTDVCNLNMWARVNSFTFTILTNLCFWGRWNLRNVTHTHIHQQNFTHKLNLLTHFLHLTKPWQYSFKQTRGRNATWVHVSVITTMKN